MIFELEFLSFIEVLSYETNALEKIKKSIRERKHLIFQSDNDLKNKSFISLDDYNELKVVSNFGPNFNLEQVLNEENLRVFQKKHSENSYIRIEMSINNSKIFALIELLRGYKLK